MTDRPLKQAKIVKLNPGQPYKKHSECLSLAGVLVAQLQMLDEILAKRPDTSALIHHGKSQGLG